MAERQYLAGWMAADPEAANWGKAGVPVLQLSVDILTTLAGGVGGEGAAELSAGCATRQRRNEVWA